MTVIDGLQLAGLAAFAASGVEASRQCRPDVVGALILAFATALGGGVIRDAILGRPAASFASTTHLLVILCAAAATLALPRVARRFAPTLRVADAFGLGLFNASGFVLALDSGHVTPAFAVVLGAITGTGGGILRDVLCGQMPALLRPGEIYITACVAGGFAGLAVFGTGGSRELAALLVATVTIGLRLLAIRHRWTLGPIG